jgi:hypothetical protein
MRIPYLLSGLAEGQVFSPQLAMRGTDLIQELVETEAQRPEPDNAVCRTDLVVVAAHQFFQVGEKDFNGPAVCHMVDALFQRVLPPAGRPVVAWVERVVRMQLGNEHLTGAQFAHPGLDQVGIDDFFIVLDRLRDGGESSTVSVAAYSLTESQR